MLAIGASAERGTAEDRRGKQATDWSRDDDGFCPGPSLPWHEMDQDIWAIPLDGESKTVIPVVRTMCRGTRCAVLGGWPMHCVSVQRVGSI